MKARITNKYTGESFISTNKSKIEHYKVDEAFIVDIIPTRMLSHNNFRKLKRCHNSLQFNVKELKQISELINSIVEESPTDTALDAEMLQIADDATQSVEDLLKLVRNLLGKNIE